MEKVKLQLLKAPSHKPQESKPSKMAPSFLSQIWAQQTQTRPYHQQRHQPRMLMSYITSTSNTNSWERRMRCNPKMRLGRKLTSSLLLGSPNMKNSFYLINLRAMSIWRRKRHSQITSNQTIQGQWWTWMTLERMIKIELTSLVLDQSRVWRKNTLINTSTIKSDIKKIIIFLMKKFGNSSSKSTEDNAFKGIT